MSDVTELIEELRAHKQRNYRQQTKLDWNAADTLARLQSRNELLEAVRKSVLAFREEPESSERFDVLHHELDEALAAAEDKP